MKRISFDTDSTALDMLSQPMSSARKSLPDSYTTVNIKKTSVDKQVKTEQSQTFGFPNGLFYECFPSLKVQEKQEKRFHNLKYRSLEKNKHEKQPKIELERKTFSLQDSFKSFGRENLQLKNINCPTSRSGNSCLITDFVESQKLEKRNVFQVCQNTGRSCVMVSTMNSVHGENSKYSNCLNSKLFLSQDLKSPNNHSSIFHINTSNDCQKALDAINTISKIEVSQLKQQIEQNQHTFNSKRLSTNQSIKMKENLETNQSQVLNQLDCMSILCESIRVNQAKPTQKQFLEKSLTHVDSMKASLIEKLDIFRKDQNFMDLKKTNFIRSKKSQKQNLESEKLLNQEANQRQLTQNTQQNEEEDDTQNFKFDPNYISGENIFIRNKFKTLDQCGYTIVSRYNKSSDHHKSILQESNIVFQASKMYDQSSRDSRFQQNNEENLKPYNSFIYDSNLGKETESRLGNSDDGFMKKKMRGMFLRSNKSTSQKEIRARDDKVDDELDIRFDLDTFIEYGPL